jgi:hypothetical protein
VNTIVARDRNLDFAILRLAEPAGAHPVGGNPKAPTRGWLSPKDHAFEPAEPLSIIQHPRADYKKFAFGSQCEGSADPSFVSYKINTQPGSSGSPCFTHDWKLVALHFYGDPAEKHNRGVKWSAIMRALQQDVKQLIVQSPAVTSDAPRSRWPA